MVINEILNMKDGLEKLTKLERIYGIKFIKTKEEYDKLSKDEVLYLYTISSAFKFSKEESSDFLSLTYAGLTHKDSILEYRLGEHMTIIKFSTDVYLGGVLLAIDTHRGCCNE